MIGRTLGHYRIEAKLGEGGMGVVYRAHDTHLDRPVAIKVLSAAAVANPERKRRFVQEAKAASALNHPNILHIYDIDTADGIDFIAMEYVAGQTLEQRIERHRPPVRELLRYAVQMTDALSKAHAAGIVHRDLKPANVMVTEDGVVKLLDFGLAKLTEPHSDDETETTRSMSPRTEEGMILGTVAYMSPEQAEGQKVDARSDIFSFGSVLYEMVTGRRPFEGRTRMSTLTAILREEPVPVRELAEGSSPELDRIIIRCLRKDPGYRFQHMDDLKVALRELLQEAESGKLSPVTVPQRRTSKWAVGAGVLLASVAGGAIAWRIASRTPQPVSEAALTRLTSDSGLTTDPALSPDGKLVAYASDRAGESLDIWVQQLAGGDPIRLTRDEADDRAPSFSPDGSKIAYRSEREGGGIYVISTLGGEPRLVAKSGRHPRFSPDGNWIAYNVGDDQVIYPSKLYVAPAAGGPVQQLQPEFVAARYPIWSPDGRHLLFFGTQAWNAPPGAVYDWWVAPVAGGAAVRTGALGVFQRHSLTFNPTASAIVAADWVGDEILFPATLGDSTSLWLAAISPRSWRITSVPRRLTLGASLEFHPSIAPGPAGTQRLVFASLTSSVDIWSLPIEANRGKALGEVRRVTQDPAEDTRPWLTPDGKRVVFSSKRSGNEDIWVRHLATGKEKPLTAPPLRKYNPALSADGSRIAYQVVEGGRGVTYTLPVAGGPPERLCENCFIPTSWSSDGKTLLSFAAGPGGGLLRIDVSTGKPALLAQRSGYDLLSPRFSPDDRWVAFHVRKTPLARQIYVVPFRPGDGSPVAENEWIAVTGGEYLDREPRWSPDGNLLYFASERDGFRCIWAHHLDPVSKRPVGTPLAVYHFHRARLSSRTPDTGLLGMSIAAGQMVLSLEGLSGNIWLATLPASK